MSDTERDNLREGLASLREELRVGMAEMRGRLDTLAASRSGDVDRLHDRLDAESRERTGLEQSVRAVHRRLDEYPKPEDIKETIGLARANQMTLGKITAIAAAVGIPAGSLSAWMFQVLT